MRSAPSADARAEQVWIERAGGQTVAGAWFAPRGAAPRASAVLIVPGPGHEQRAMGAGLMACAEALAAHGLGALVVDLHGCGQSSGRLDDADLAGHWRADLQAAFAALRARANAAPVVVGVRLGALLAADALAAGALGPLRPLGFAGWMPVVSGRRHLRELRLLAPATSDSMLSIGGFDWPAPLTGHLSRLDLAPIDTDAVLVLDADERSARAFDAVRAAPATRRAARDSGAWLFGDRDDPPPPAADIAELVAWCAGLANAPARDPAPGRRLGAEATFFTHAGRAIREDAVEIGPGRLHGVLCRPADAAAVGATRLLASTVGPGRTFVDFARDQAALGHASLRFDFAGFGISPVAPGEAGGRVYAPGGADDVAAAVRHLRATGHSRVVPIGYCAGAWSMLQAGAAAGWSPRNGVDAVVAINVQLQHVPEPAEGASTASRRFARLGRRVARRLGAEHVARWLGRTRRAAPLDWVSALADAGATVLLAYADRDPGLASARRHVEARPSPRVRIEVVDRLGHLAENTAARGELLRRIAAQLATVDATAAVARPAPPAAARADAAPAPRAATRPLGSLAAGFAASTIQ